MRPLIYISGPITVGDRDAHLCQFNQMHRLLMDRGFSVINPGLTMLLPWAWDVDHDTWIECCEPHVARSDACLRLPGFSKGAVQEEQFASLHGVPWFTNFADLVLHFERLENVK